MTMMETNAYDVLAERGFLYQTTDGEGLREYLGKEPATFYIGFDPTADSLHVGSLVPIMAMVHMQQAGHRPIALVGGGTAMVGDPSGKTEMRRMLTLEQILKNAEGLRRQLSHYVDVAGERGLMLNNAAWLLPLNYVEFLRDIGRHFSVNRMLTAESYKIRLETGLSFLEFNYQLLQAYDFCVLARDYNCHVQMGGQDQWGNIVAGIDLIRRKLNRTAFGATFPLITNSSGQKFGKSVAGAIWLDGEKTPPFEYYQFWRNTEDADVARFLGLFTLLPMDEVRMLSALEPPLLNRAKEILAYEATRLTHGKEKADQAFASALQQFGTADPEGRVETSSEIRLVRAAAEDIIPSTDVPRGQFESGADLGAILVDAGVVPSRAEFRRLVQQGGVTVNGARADALPVTLTLSSLEGDAVLVKLGKKRLHRLQAV